MEVRNRRVKRSQYARLSSNPDPTETGKWTQWSQNDEGAWAWNPFKQSNIESNESYLPSFSDAFDPKEAQKQNDFLSKFVPALQKGRSDIWGAYNSAYGQDAIKNLYLDFGEYGGGPNLLTKEIGGNVNAPEFYDPTNRSLKKFLGGPVDLFKQAAKDPKHFGIVGGPGYLPYSYDEIASDPSKLSSLGLFLDDKGKPIIGGVRSTPNNPTGLSQFAEMMPLVLGMILTGGAASGFGAGGAAGAAGAGAALS